MTQYTTQMDAARQGIITPQMEIVAEKEHFDVEELRELIAKGQVIIPCIELILAIVATLIPFSVDEIGDKVPMIVIFIVLLLIGEVVRVVSAKGRETEYKGLTPELAAQRLAEESEED